MDAGCRGSVIDVSWLTVGLADRGDGNGGGAPEPGRISSNAVVSIPFMRGKVS